MRDETFKARFEALTGHAPFPWQIRLYEEWFAKGEFPPSCSLPTGFADNADWRNDPRRPAVIVGTVDMAGSRLLLAGYGCGFKSKPLHAGFLIERPHRLRQDRCGGIIVTVGQTRESRVFYRRRTLGPFRLGYYEALIHVADWRASEKASR